MGQYLGTFRQLVAWKAAKALTLEVYRVTKQFPREEIYGLVSQMRRAAVSDMSNIAEGNQRRGHKEKIHFFEIAMGSLTELDNQADLAYELGYVSKIEFERLLELINKSAYLIVKLIESIQNPQNPHSRQNPHYPNAKGFSLVELLVVISIVSLLSAGAVLGFGSLSTTLRAKEVVGFLGDTLRQEELKVLRGDLSKARVHFMKDFLVIEEWSEDSTSDLSLDETCGSDPKNYQIDHKAGNLIQKDGEGEIISVTNVGQSTPCIHFDVSPDLEWNYQLKTEGGAKSSALLRFVHFNLQRDRKENAFTLGSNIGSVVEIQSPYGKKRLIKLNSDDTYSEANSLSFSINSSDASVGESFQIDLNTPIP